MREPRHTPLGESIQGGGRTIFGTSFFGATPPPGTASLELEGDVSGALGGGLVMHGRATLTLQG